jgi:hypothetical protein
MDDMVFRLAVGGGILAGLGSYDFWSTLSGGTEITDDVAYVGSSTSLYGGGIRLRVIKLERFVLFDTGDNLQVCKAETDRGHPWCR